MGCGASTAVAPAPAWAKPDGQSTLAEESISKSSREKSVVRKVVTVQQVDASGKVVTTTTTTTTVVQTGSEGSGDGHAPGSHSTEDSRHGSPLPGSVQPSRSESGQLEPRKPSPLKRHNLLSPMDATPPGAHRTASADLHFTDRPSLHSRPQSDSNLAPLSQHADTPPLSHPRSRLQPLAPAASEGSQSGGSPAQLSTGPLGRAVDNPTHSILRKQGTSSNPQSRTNSASKLSPLSPASLHTSSQQPASSPPAANSSQLPTRSQQPASSQPAASSSQPASPTPARPVSPVALSPFTTQLLADPTNSTAPIKSDSPISQSILKLRNSISPVNSVALSMPMLSVSSHTSSTTSHARTPPSPPPTSTSQQPTPPTAACTHTPPSSHQANTSPALAAGTFSTSTSGPGHVQFHSRGVNGSPQPGTAHAVSSANGSVASNFSFGPSPSFGYLVGHPAGPRRDTDAAREEDSGSEGGLAASPSRQLYTKSSAGSDHSGVSGRGSVDSIGSLLANVSTGPSLAAIKTAGMTGADLVSRAVQRGMGSFKRISVDGTLPLAATPKTNRHVSTCAVSLAFLLEFSSKVPPEMSTLDVVYKMIVPETAKHRCRYVELVPDEHLNRPDYFVSHRWAAPFKNLVSSVFLHFDCANALAKGTLDPTTVFLWLDIFAVNQHPGEAQAGDLAGLQAALGASTAGTLLCLDEAGMVLTRIWCLYEIHHTIRLKGVPGLRVLAADVQFTELKDIFNSLNAKHAQATVEEDRRRILADIEATTGIVALNQSIKEALVESCLLEAVATEARKQVEPSAYVAAHYKAGQMLRVAGKYREAEEALNKTIQVYEQGLGVEDKMYAVCLISLGTLMQEEGKLQEAERLCREGLSLSQALLDGTVARYRMGGQEMPAQDMTYADMMAANNALAGVLQAQGKLSQALQFCDKAVAMSRLVHGDEHPDTATAMQSLALLHQAMGKSNEALRLLKKVLALREKHMGTEHPLTAVALDALGMVYQQRGSFRAAEPLFLKALGVRRRLLGEMHPAVASSLHNLGGLMADEARVEEAEAFYVTALQIREQVLGPGHPAYASTLNNLAALYKEAGRVDEAVPLLQHALEARALALGEDHPATNSSLNNLATLLLEKGHVEDALPLYMQQVRTLERVLGPDHPDVALALENYATCLKRAGNYTQAEQYYRRAVAILESQVDPNHPDLAHCITRLAALLQETGQLQEATAHYERALGIQMKIHGDQHSSLVTLLHSLGVIAAKQGSLDAAEKRLLAAVSMRRSLNNCLSTNPSRPLSAIAPHAKSALSQDPGSDVNSEDLDVGVVAAGLITRNAAVAAFNQTAVQAMAANVLDGDCQLAASLTELGNVQQDLGQLEEALESYTEAHDLRAQALGEDHPDTALTRENLACLLLDLNKTAQAEPLLQSALEVNLLKATGGVAALSAYNLGRCLEKLGGSRWEETKAAYSKAVALAETCLGPDHDDTVQYMENLQSFLNAGQATKKTAKKSRRGHRSAKAANESDDEGIEIEYE